MAKSWKPEEDNYLRKHWADSETEAIALHLGRSHGACTTRASLLNAKKDFATKSAQMKRAQRIQRENGQWRPFPKGNKLYLIKMQKAKERKERAAEALARLKISGLKITTHRVQ